jgi:hypothetical protein
MRASRPRRHADCGQISQARVRRHPAEPLGRDKPGDYSRLGAHWAVAASVAGDVGHNTKGPRCGHLSAMC